MPQRDRRSFSPQQKADAVRLVAQVGNLSRVARDLDLSPNLLRRWVKQAEIDAGKGPPGALTSEERAELVRLRRGEPHAADGARLPKKSRGLLRQGPGSACELIEAEKANYPISLMCRALKISRSALYAWRARRPRRIERARADGLLATQIAQVHAESRSVYGSPRVHRKLRNQGVRVARKRVARLMREVGLRGKVRRRWRNTTESNHTMPVAPNTLNRQFAAPASDTRWVVDITYIPISGGFGYLAVILDLYSRMIVGWALEDHLRTELAVKALNMALGSRVSPGGLLHHSDRGCQYASVEYRELLARRGIEVSMSRRGNCYDNAVVESFFGTLKQELVHDSRWATLSEARAALHDYVEVFYNRQRLHSALGYRTPAEVDRQSA